MSRRRGRGRPRPLRRCRGSRSSLEERLDGDLVGSVVGARVGAAPLARLAREREQRGRSRDRARRTRASRSSSGGTGVARPLRVGERVGDRDAHVGVSEVRDRRAVAEADEAVHDRGRVDRRPRSARTGGPKRKCASISSRPLLASVAESIVIFGPIDQVGCASASSGRDRPSSSARAAPERATARREDDALRLAQEWRTGRGPSARCRRGSARPPPRARARSASSPAATRLSLLASASVTPCSSAHIVGTRPAKPTTAFSTMSGRARSSSSVGSPPVCVSGASPSIGCRRRMRRRRARAPGARRSPRSPGARSSRSRRAGRSASSPGRVPGDRPARLALQARHRRAWPARRGCPADERRAVRRCCSAKPNARCRSTPPGRRRGARRAGRACPPWPPSSAPASLTPASRFSIDSNRSPSGAATAITAPRTSDCEIVRKCAL